jgi:hypothetical protein
MGQCFGWRLSIALSWMGLPYRSGRGTSLVLGCGWLLVPGVGAGRQRPRPGRGGAGCARPSPDFGACARCERGGVQSARSADSLLESAT